MSASNLPRHLKLIGVIGEATSHVSLLPEIPRLMVHFLPLDRVAFALVDNGAGAPSRVLVAAGFESCDDSSGELNVLPISSEKLTTSLATMGPDMDDVRQSSASSRSDGNAFRATRAQHAKMVRQVGAKYQMVLILHWGRRVPEIPPETAEFIESLCDPLVYSLGVLLSWWECPASLGERFAKLTGRQWQVLCHLYGGLSEKELAASLTLSPHTLHCHIKTIFLTLGVRSRLEALRLLEQAVRCFRVRAMGWSGGHVTPLPP